MKSTNRMRSSRLPLLAVCALATLAAKPAKAQLDQLHLVPPIYYGLAEGGSNTSNFDRHYLVISTPSAEAVSVSVSDGAGNVILNTQVSNSTPITHLLGRLTDGVYGSTKEGASGNVIGTSKLNTPTKDGLIIKADAPVYANIRHQSGYQGASLTAKGCAALGTDFRIATMRNNNAVNDYRSLFFSVMAAEDNTTILVTDIKPGVVFTGTKASGSPLTTQEIKVTLAKGESYTVGVKVDQYALEGGTASLNDVNGTRVISDKPIVINSGTVLGCPVTGNTGSRDMGFDQIAPVTRAGTEYVLVKGSAVNGSELETPMVVATQDDTNVFVNGNLSPVNSAPLKAGDYLFLDGYYTDQGNIYVEASHPILMWQNMAGEDSPATPGLNFVPPLNRDIAQSVNNIANINLIGDATVNVVALAGEKVTIDGKAPETGPLAVGGTKDWVSYSQTGLTGNPVVESSGAIAVSLNMLKSPIGAGGYYSGYPDFKPLIEPVDPQENMLPNVVLSAIDPSGGIFTSYEWFYANGKPTGVTGTSYTPKEEGAYFVVATAASEICPFARSADFVVERRAESNVWIKQEIAATREDSGKRVHHVALTIGNDGPDPAESCLVKDILPKGIVYVEGSLTGGDGSADNDPNGFGLVWKIERLEAETIRTLSFKCIGTVEGTYKNVSTVSCESQETNLTDNEAAEAITVWGDSDNDGIPDEDEGRDDDLDTDGDGIPNYLDPDDDNDGIPTLTDPKPLCTCESRYVEFEIGDLNLLEEHGIDLESYKAGRDVWHQVKDYLHCVDEATPLEQEKRGFDEERFYVEEDSEILVTVIYDGADYINSLAYYHASDPGETWTTIWEKFGTGPKAPLIPGSSTSLGVLPAGSELRFGLVMDGGNGGTKRIYQDPMLNPAGQEFMAGRLELADGNPALIVAFEDQLFENRDNDFNDVIVMVEMIPTSLGDTQHDNVVSGMKGLHSNDGDRGVTALLEKFEMNSPEVEFSQELFHLPAGDSEITMQLLDDRSSMKFSLALFNYEHVAVINPASLQFREVAAKNATVIVDDRSENAGDEVVFNPADFGLDGATVGVMLIPNNTVDTFLTNAFRYTPRGEGDRTKRQPLFSINNANPGSMDQMFVFGDETKTLLTFEDHSRAESNEEGEASDSSFDDIQIMITPGLKPVGFHQGGYEQARPDVTVDWDGEDGYSEEFKGNY